MTIDEMLFVLREYGVDMDGIYRRFCGDMELYITCIRYFQKESNFSMLADSMRCEDYDQAYFCAHALKGAAANLGLIAIFDWLTLLLDELHTAHYEAARKTYADLLQEMLNLQVLLSGGALSQMRDIGVTPSGTPGDTSKED